MASHMPENYAEDRLHRYIAHWTRDPSNLSVLDVDAISWATEEERSERVKNYCEVASDYYDLVTPLYEQGWCVLEQWQQRGLDQTRRPSLTNSICSGASSFTTRPSPPACRSARA